MKFPIKHTERVIKGQKYLVSTFTVSSKTRLRPGSDIEEIQTNHNQQIQDYLTNKYFNKLVDIFKPKNTIGENRIMEENNGVSRTEEG